MLTSYALGPVLTDPTLLVQTALSPMLADPTTSTLLFLILDLDG